MLASTNNINVINLPTVQAVSGTLQIWSAGTIGVSATVPVQIWSAGTVGISASIPIRVWDGGTQGISGTVNIGTMPQMQVSNFPSIQAVSGNVGSTIQNWPNTIGVSASVPLQIWSEGNVGISGSVSVSNSQFSINNFPAVQAVSGNVGSFIQNWPAVFGVSGTLTVAQGVTQTAQNVSSTLGLRVWNDAPVGISASVPIQIWSADTIGVSGSFTVTQGVTQTAQNVSSSAGLRVFNDSPVGISASVPLQIWSAGTIGVSGTFTSVQGVTQTAQNVSSTLGLRVWNDALVGVSGSVTVGGWSSSVTGTVNVANLQQFSISTPISITNFDLSTATYSGSYAFTNDSTLSQLELRFSTNQPRSITASLSNGEILFSELNSNYHVQVDFENYAIDIGTTLILSVSQTAGACLLNGDLTAEQFTSPFQGQNAYTFTNPLPVALGDSAQNDAFSRQRVSQPQSIFYSAQIYGDDTINWETQKTGAGADVVFLPNESTVQMTTGATTSGNFVVRSTRRSFRYEPGKSQLIAMTFVFDSGAVSNVRRRIGYFNSNNGIFLELNGSALRLVRRTYTSGTPVDNVVEQADWNIDKLDGKGISGITIDISKAQILIIDLQWLGVGRVRVGFDIDGVPHYVHQFKHANSLDRVYMTTAHLNCRLEIENTSTAGAIATLRHICTSVIAEGSNTTSIAKQFNTNTGAAVVSITAANRRPLLSIRAKTTAPNGGRNISSISTIAWDIANASSNQLYWEVILNGTLTGPSWAAYDSTKSIAERDTTATAISGGILIDSGYIANATNVRLVAASTAVSDLLLYYSDLLGQQDTLSIVGTAVGGTATAFSSMNWTEDW